MHMTRFFTQRFGLLSLWCSLCWLGGPHSLMAQSAEEAAQLASEVRTLFGRQPNTEHERARYREIMEWGQAHGYPQVVAIAASALGSDLSAQGELRASLSCYRQSLRARLQLNDPQEATKGFCNLGTQLMAIGRGSQQTQYFDSAQAMLDSAMRYFLLIPGKDTLTQLPGFLYSLQGHVSNGLYRYRDGLAAHRKALYYHLHIPSKRQEHLYSLAFTFFQLEQYDSTLAYLDRYGSSSPAHPRGRAVYSLRGNTFTKLSQYDSAMWYHQRALDYWQSQVTPPPDELAKVLVNLGYLYERREDWPQAASYYSRALRQAKTAEDKALQLTCHQNLRDVRASQGSFRAALSHANQAIHLRDQLLQRVRSQQLTDTRRLLENAYLREEQARDEAQIVGLQEALGSQRLAFVCIAALLLSLMALLLLRMSSQRKLVRAERAEKESIRRLQAQREATHREQLKAVASRYNERLSQTIIQAQHRAQHEVHRQMRSLGDNLHDFAQSNLSISRTLLTKLLQELSDSMTLKQQRDGTFVEEAIERTRQELRQLSHQLQDGIGLAFQADLPTFLQDVQHTFALLEQTNALRTEYRAEGLTGLTLPVERLTHLAMLVQEAINNVLVHAEATQLRLHLRRVAQHLELRIADNGKGLPPGTRISSLEKRVAQLGGCYEVLPAEFPNARGTHLFIKIPLSA